MALRRDIATGEMASPLFFQNDCVLNVRSGIEASSVDVSGEEVRSQHGETLLVEIDSKEVYL